MKNKIIFTIALMSLSFLGVTQTAVKAVTQPIDYSGKIYVTVEKEAQFPGGDPAWQQYLKENFKGTTAIKNSAPEGTYLVVVRFIVAADGTISDVSPLTKLGYGIEEDAINVIRKGPKWIPAVQKGKRVNSFKKQELTLLIKTK